MKERKISVSISPDGIVNIDVLNAIGRECEEWTKEVEQTLAGGLPTNKTKKTTYYQEAHTSQIDEQSEGE